MLADMTHCAYCGQPATMTIVSSPDRVCFTHAMEFWGGLMVYAKERSPSEPDALAGLLRPCLEHATP
jgi:hypothetical protein